MEWFQLHSAGILRGSMSQAEDWVQVVWIKLMALANEAKNPLSGRLEYAHGQPYERDYIAMLIHKPVWQLDDAIELFKKDISHDGTPRITVETDGTIVLNNWARYNDNRVKAEVKNVGIKKQELQGRMKRSSIDRLTENVAANTAATAKLANAVDRSEVVKND